LLFVSSVLFFKVIL